MLGTIAIPVSLIRMSLFLESTGREVEQGFGQLWFVVSYLKKMLMHCFFLNVLFTMPVPDVTN